MVKHFDEVLQLSEDLGSAFMAVPLTQSDLTHQDLEDLQFVFAIMPEAFSASNDEFQSSLILEPPNWFHLISQILLVL